MTDNDSAGTAAELDWLRIAKAAGEHGIRYRTNSSLEAFLRDIAAPASPSPGLADMAAFGASEAACYEYPEADQAPLREAFCKGAAFPASPSPGLLEPMTTFGMVQMREAVIEECAKVADKVAAEFQMKQSPMALTISPEAVACRFMAEHIRALSRPVSEREDGQ